MHAAPRTKTLRALAAVALLASLSAAAPALATTATVDPGGNLLVNGAPFFPIGAYHVSWIGNRQGKKTVPDLHVIADAGFNLLHPSIDARSDMIDLFDAATARGVYVLGEIPWPANGPQDFINKWKNHPAIIGWNILDDFNAPYHGTPNHPASQAIERRDVVRALAPNQLVFGSGGAFPGFRIAEYAGTMDAMGFQSYPVSAGNNEEVEWLQENLDSYDWVRDQLAGTNQLFWAVPQAFRWKGSVFTGPARWPTDREERNMVYAALARGAKGVFYYTTWGENGFLPQVNPSLWSEIGREVVELESLTPFLLHGDRSELSTGNARLYGALWTYRSQVLVVLLSTDYAASHAVAIDLPAGTVGPARRVFPARPEAGLVPSAGQLVGSVGPQDVHVVLLDRVAAGDQQPVAIASTSPPVPAFGDAITFDASSSSDGDGTVVGWDWDFGDGALASGAIAVHAYAHTGSYPVRLTVWDDDGNAATTQLELEIGVTSLCPAAPPSGCVRAPAGGARIDLKTPGPAARRSLAFTWSGADVALAELGDPTSTTEVALCLWDAGGRALATSARADASKWTALGGLGFRERDRSASPGGISNATLRPGPGPVSLLSFKGKGTLLPDPGLPLVAPAIAQIRTSDGPTCWEAVFPASGVTQNGSKRFRAQSGS